MMDTASNWVIVGRFGRPYGIKGLITVQSFTDPVDNILKYPEWHVFIKKKWQPLAITHIELNNKAILAKVEGYQSREDVAALTNAEIAVRHEHLPQLGQGEYYWYQLIGLSVENTKGIQLGKVTEVMTTGSNDVLVVEGGGRHLIPYLLDDVILKIDTQENLILVDWDEDF